MEIYCCLPVGSNIESQRETDRRFTVSYDSYSNVTDWNAQKRFSLQIQAGFLWQCHVHKTFILWNMRVIKLLSWPAMWLWKCLSLGGYFWIEHWALMSLLYKLMINKHPLISWANENPTLNKTRLGLNMIYSLFKKPQAIDFTAEFWIYEPMFIFTKT